MKSTVAPVLRRAAPSLYFGLRRVCHRASRYGRLTRRLGHQLDWRVATGPFAGMRYRNTDPANRPTTKLLGAYESELHTHLAAAIEAGPRRVINIGCAEGYYAAGFALALPDAEIEAYDISKNAREECAETAGENGVRSRVLVRSRCDAAELGAAGDRTLVICDIEGGECDVLDPGRAPGLRQANIIVELHDCFRAGATQLLIDRFQSSHRIALVEPGPRNASCYAALGQWTREDARLALSEARPFRQQWACLTPMQ